MEFKKSSTTPLTLPQDNSIDALSIRYSQTPFFVSQLIKERGIDSAVEVLTASNSRRCIS